MTASPNTFIKGEPEDFEYPPNKNFTGLNMSQGYGNHFTTSNGDMNAINPSDLTMGSNMGQFGSHMSTSFVGDDELLDLTIEERTPQFDNFTFASNGNTHGNGQGYPAGVPMSQPTPQMFSHTPEAQPASPFNYGYNQYRHSISGQPGLVHSIPTSMAMPNGYGMNGRIRKMASMERHPSDSRSPMTPKTPVTNGIPLGSTPDSVQQHAYNQTLHDQAREISQHSWAGSGSVGAQSWDDECSLPSPHSMHGHMQHAQISEIIATGKHASMPAKMENGGPMPAIQSQEAKKKRRRESHNAVERRRRDNINERISDLSKLVPQHRLEDEKVKKHISNNGPLSPTFNAPGMSPPQATSLLAGGAGKRAAGNITQGLPMEDKDKGPNKGDILNGSVSWMRDLMWMVYVKLQQEEQLKEYIESLGGTWPLDSTKVDEYMKTEIIDAVERNGPDNFHYTRAPGTGLRVPKHTNLAGEPLSPSAGVSPGLQSGGSGASTGGQLGGQQQFWIHQNSLKEESEEDYGMDMG